MVCGISAAGVYAGLLQCCWLLCSWSHGCRAVCCCWVTPSFCSLGLLLQQSLLPNNSLKDKKQKKKKQNKCPQLMIVRQFCSCSTIAYFQRYVLQNFFSSNLGLFLNTRVYTLFIKLAVFFFSFCLCRIKIKSN